jgi:hypothetical protein
MAQKSGDTYAWLAPIAVLPQLMLEEPWLQTAVALWPVGGWAQGEAYGSVK